MCTKPSRKKDQEKPCQDFLTELERKIDLGKENLKFSDLPCGISSEMFLEKFQEISKLKPK